ncbi:hypothetical protein ABVK25_011789 [Lepraria finkii]|uniref:Uncharacterized protein n=1 Tax=Lepraria finkii TaxID=1340010 RepID=A0ABR4ASR8_9LECA
MEHLRGWLLKEIAASNDRSALASKFDQATEWLEENWSYWDSQFDDYGYDENSFYRTSWRLQVGYSQIISYSAILAKIQGPSTSIIFTDATGQYSDHDTSEIIRSTSSVAFKQMEDVYGCESYKWSLMWATTQAALLATFIGINDGSN